MGLKRRSSWAKEMRRAKIKIASELQEVVEDYSVDKAMFFRRVVNNWKLKPRFVVQSQMTEKVYYAAVKPSGEHGDKFVWIDVGTGRHGPEKRSYIIRPKNAAVLRFQTGHNPKTAAVARFGVGDGGFSGDTVFANEVEHPGIKSRLFNETYDENKRKEFRKNVKKAIIKGIEKAR